MSYASNPKAFYDYEMLETLEAGVVLSGQETKSVRSGKVSMHGSYVKILNGPSSATYYAKATKVKKASADMEAFWVGGQISPYQANNVPADYDNQRTRKLLVKKTELKYLTDKSQEKGLTLIPLKLYDKHGMIKLEIGIARGKKKYDKREKIKLHDIERAKQRGLEK